MIMMKISCKGFTLIELMIALALALLLLTLGIPSFKELIQSNRLTTAADDLLAALQLTRSEAIKRGIRITLCKSANGTSCSNSGGYEQGWIVFSDSNNNVMVDTEELIIRVFAPVYPGSGISLTGNVPVANYISYTADGIARLANGAFQAGTLTVCMSPQARQIVLNNVGRIKLSKASACL